MTSRFRTNPSVVSVFVPPDAIYPGLAEDESALIELLSGLSRDDTLLICARLNTIVSGFGGLNDAQRQQKACALICSQEQRRRLDAFARLHGGLDRVVVFFRGQLLEMIWRAAQHCQNLPGDGETFKDEQVRDRFFRAVLIAGSLWGQRIYGNRLSLNDGLNAARQRALAPFRKGLEDSSRALDTPIALGRGWLLFSKYLPRRMPNFATCFRAETGLTVKEYLICVGALTTYTFADRESPLFWTDSVAAGTALDRVFPAYLALESLSPEELAEAAPDLPRTGFRALRDRPVLSTSRGVSVVVDPVIYGETLASGPLFHLVAREKNILGYFGEAFEDYAIDVLRQMYPAGSGLLAPRLITNIPGRDGRGVDFEIDAALNDVTEIVIFEMKAAWLPEASLLDATGANFLQELRRRYSVLPAQDGVRKDPKGAAQLAKIIGAIARKEWVGDKGEFSKVAKIYPVLVVHDERLDIPGSGKFLDEEFKSLLGAVPTGVVVAPLTIMTIGDLENLETSVTKFGLRDLLYDYTREHPDRVQSLQQFMATSSYATRLSPSKRVLAASEELMRRIQDGIFPKQG